MTSETVPSEAAMRAAAAVASRVSDRAMQLRRAFVVGQGEAPPPMTQLLRGGRGGEVRLKLLLSLLWFAANPPYDATYPARSWAQLLDLRDPEKAGARRITEALAWLEDRKFIGLNTRPGLPSRVTLRNELGDGAAYEVPGAAWRRLGLQGAPASEEVRRRERYVQLPSTFWTNGWLALLDGAAVTMLLVLLAERPSERTRGLSSPTWFSPAEAKRRYGLSPATRTKGLSQLAKADLVDVSRLAVADDPFDLRRRRNGYTLMLGRLDMNARLSLVAAERATVSAE